ADFARTDGPVEAVVLADGTVLPTDVVVVGIGAIPNTAWLEGSGIELGNGVLCDAVGATNIPGVVAVGDCAAWWDPAAGRHHRVEHWTGAAERPAVALGALLGADPATLPAVKPPYFWSDQYGTRLQFAGDAAGAERIVYEHGDPRGRPSWPSTTPGKTRSRCWPGTRPSSSAAGVRPSRSAPPPPPGWSPPDHPCTSPLLLSS
ncbi:FAD-dependent oxidoreductase, partial [Kocuria oceani]